MERHSPSSFLSQTHWRDPTASCGFKVRGIGAPGREAFRRRGNWPPFLVLSAVVVGSTILHWLAARRFGGLWILPDEGIYATRATDLWRHGSLPLRHGQGGYGILYPLLIGAPLSLGSVAHGYAALKLLQAFVVSLAAVPVFVIGRRLMADRYALLASVLTVAAPVLLYSGLVMTEVLFYPVAACALLVIAYAVSSGNRSKPDLGVRDDSGCSCNASSSGRVRRCFRRGDHARCALRARRLAPALVLADVVARRRVGRGARGVPVAGRRLRWDAARRLPGRRRPATERGAPVLRRPCERTHPLRGRRGAGGAGDSRARARSPCPRVHLGLHRGLPAASSAGGFLRSTLRAASSGSQSGTAAAAPLSRIRALDVARGDPRTRHGSTGRLWSGDHSSCWCRGTRWWYRLRLPTPSIC